MSTKPETTQSAGQRHECSLALASGSAWTRDVPTQPGYYWMRFYLEGSEQDTKMAVIRRGTVDLQMQCGDGSWANLCNFDRCWWSGPLIPPALPNRELSQMVSADNR